MQGLIGDGFVNYSALLHCAVYALVRRKEVVYIGQSKSLCTRLYGWCTAKRAVKKSLYGVQIYKGISFDEIWVRPCMLAELSGLEIAMIKKYQPKHNDKHREKPKPEISLEELLKTMPIYPMLPPNPEPRRASWRRL